jgi:ADP-heptose:LPS heptosyltransferase
MHLNFKIRNWIQYTILNRLKMAFLAMTDHSSPESDGSTSVLVIRLDNIGDVVLTTPVFSELRRLLPEAHIAAVVRSQTRELLASDPHLDSIIVYDPPCISWRSPIKHVRYLIDFGRQYLSNRRWSIALNLRFGAERHDETFLCFVSRADVRVGFSSKVDKVRRITNSGVDRLYTKALTTEIPVMHEAARNIAILQCVLPDARQVSPHIYLSQEDRDFAGSALGDGNAAGYGPLIVLAFGASELKRIWPVEMYIETARQLESKLNARFVLVGSPADTQLAQRFEDSFPRNVINLVGRCSLSQSAAVIGMADLFIGNDSGPMHIASCVCRKVVCISCHHKNGDQSHDNSPVRFGPVSSNSVVLQPHEAKDGCKNGCNRDFAHCIVGVTVEEVVTRIEILLSSKRADLKS